MPIELPLAAARVPSDFCIPQTLQGIINAVAKYVTAQYNQSIPQIWFGFDTPPPSYQNGFWVRTDADGNYMGTYVFVNGEWTTIEPTSGAYVKLSYTLPAGTTGGTPVQATWTTHAINTEDFDTNNLCTLASNQFTLSEGTYRCDVISYGIRNHAYKTRLRNVTTNTSTLIGTSGYSTTDNETATTSHINGQFSSNGTDLYEIQYFSKESREYGLGRGEADQEENEVYLTAQFFSV